MLVVAIAMFASLTVLPAMLAWLGDRVEKGRIPFLGRRRRPAGQSRFWTAAHRPRHAAAAGSRSCSPAALLVALAIPALHMKTVTSGIDDLPQDLAVIKTYNQVREAFPSEGVTATVVVKADDVRSGDAAGRDRRAATSRSKASTPSCPGPRSPTATTTPSPRSRSRPRGNGTDAASIDALDEIRDEIIPATIGAGRRRHRQRQRRRGGRRRTSANLLNSGCR